MSYIPWTSWIKMEVPPHPFSWGFSIDQSAIGVAPWLLDPPGPVLQHRSFVHVHFLRPIRFLRQQSRSLPPSTKQWGGRRRHGWNGHLHRKRWIFLTSFFQPPTIIYIYMYSLNMFQPCFNMFQAYCFALTWKSKDPFFPHPEFGTSSPVLQWLLRFVSSAPRVFRTPCGKCCGSCVFVTGPGCLWCLGPWHNRWGLNGKHSGTGTRRI